MKHSAHMEKVGQVYKGFRVTRVVEVPELQSTLIELIHEKTCAQVMHIANEDSENVFSLSFRTLPEISNGVAHILEHTVLCGSERFPVKDPFFSMSRRSLNTFMNALTGTDFTCYPAATQVKKDFYNLLEVYLDAVFKPHLNELSFLQEGHRLEFTEHANPHTPLEFKGVVFNEMKGALSSPMERISEAMKESLFPNITYGCNSGGDPKIIPQLTYQQLLDFHEKFYHPSRCLFFFYGNLPLEGHLDFILRYALVDVEKAASLPNIPKQPRFAQPVHKQMAYPIAADEEVKDKTIVGLGWLTCGVLEQQTVLALNILDIILMDTDASPLKMALLKSGLCKQADSDIDEDMSEIPYVMMFRGCNKNKADLLEKVVRSTLQEIVDQGISLDAFESAMHQLEFHRSEITGNHFPFGLSLFMRSALLKQHGGKPEDGLMIHSLFGRLRQTLLEDPRYFEKLIIQYFLENTHFVRIEMTPDKGLSEKEVEEEKVLLRTIRERLTKEEKEQLVAKSSELLAFQHKQEEFDDDILPKLTLADVPLHAKDYALERETCGNIEVFHHTCFTNHIVYADLLFPMPAIAQADLSYVRLLGTMLPQLGCGGRDYKANLDYIQSNTGGLAASLSMNLKVHDESDFYPAFHIKGKALRRQAHKLLPLLQDFATSIDFTDRARLKEIILKHYTGLQSSINQSSLKYAVSLSASQLNVPSRISQLWYGLDYFWMIKNLAQNFDALADKLVDDLSRLSQEILCASGAHLVMTSDRETYDEFKGHKFYGLQDLKKNSVEKWKGEYSLPSILPQGRVITAPVAFIAKVFSTVPYAHPDSPALSVVSFLFDNMTLHAKVREQGGAYSAGATSNAMSGNFYFYSFRDPHIVNTLSAFEDAVNMISNGKFDDTDLEEAKMEMIQALDAPVAPGSRGELAYGWYRAGKTAQVRQEYRNRLINLTRQDIIKAVENHIIPNLPQGATVIFAGKELLEKENETLRLQGRATFAIESI